MSESFPYFPYYVFDYESSQKVRAMSLEAEGAYHTLLRSQWINGRVPASDAGLRGCLIKPISDAALEQVKVCFPVDRSDASVRFNPKLEAIRLRVRSAASSHRENGRKGGVISGFTRRSRASSDTLSEAQAGLKHRASGSKASTPLVDAGIPANTEDLPTGKTRATWLTPFGTAWAAAYGGEPPYAKLAKYLRPLVLKHPTDEVLGAWITYLGQTGAEYATPARFAETFGRWNGSHAAPTHDRRNDATLLDFAQEEPRGV